MARVAGRQLWVWLRSCPVVRFMAQASKGARESVQARWAHPAATRQQTAKSRYPSPMRDGR
ncbi:hypothetical protein GCM10017612_05680 [Novosphingobium resinovorum]|nr:hypothetical protein GCM10017612_05680 [Novosphingobium resinovorum]